MQYFVFFLLFLTTICLASPFDDDSKTCFFMIGSSDANAKCSAYCKTQKNKAGGSCQKRRCVCFGGSSKEDKDGKNGNSQSRQLLLPNIDATLCQFYCKNLEKFDGLYVKDICHCSK